MWIFELVRPGTWLELPDQDNKMDIETILLYLQTEFFEANLALNLFSQAIQRLPVPSQDEWEAVNRRRSEIRQALEAELENSDQGEISFQTDVILKHEQWQNGKVPSLFENRKVFIYAKAFLSALDTFGKFLGVLEGISGVPAEEISSIHVDFNQHFPDLRKVVNSNRHKEDRSRGLGVSKNSKMVLQPIQNDFIHAPAGGVLLLDTLNGSRYGNTTADGIYGEVDVSRDSMEKLQSILQRIYNSFSWKGAREHLP